MTKVVSPLNTKNCIKLKTLPSEYINTKLSNYLGAPLKSSVKENYDLFKCETSGLVFASPMVGDSSEFYDELGRYSWYYSKYRWEWDIIENELSTYLNYFELLDVGCGSGVFMQRLKKKFEEAEICGICGIDYSEASVSEAISAGLNASTESIEDLKIKKLVF